METVEVSRENWREVADALVADPPFIAVKFLSEGKVFYDISAGRTTYRLPEALAQELANEGELSPVVYARLFMAGLRRQ